MRMKPASKGLAFFLALSLIFSSFVPLSVFAAEGDSASSVIKEIKFASLGEALKADSTVAGSVSVTDALISSGSATESSLAAVESTATITWTNATGDAIETSTFGAAGTYVAKVTVSSKAGFSFATPASVMTAKLGEISATTKEAIGTTGMAFEFAVEIGEVDDSETPPDPGDSTGGALSSVAALTSLSYQVSGGAVESVTGFNADKLEYDVVLQEVVTNTSVKVWGEPVETATAPPVTVEITDITTNTAAEVVVTAQDETTTKAYIVNFTVKNSPILTTGAVVGECFPTSSALNQFVKALINGSDGTSVSAIDVEKIENVTSVAITGDSIDVDNLIGIYWFKALTNLTIDQKAKADSTKIIIPEGLNVVSAAPNGFSITDNGRSFTATGKISEDITITYRAVAGTPAALRTLSEDEGIMVTANVKATTSETPLPEDVWEITPKAITISIAKGSTSGEGTFTITTTGAIATSKPAVVLSKPDATTATAVTGTGFTVTATTTTSIGGVDVTINATKAQNKTTYGVWCDGEYAGTVDITVTDANTGGNNSGGSNGGGGGSSSSKYTVSFNSMGGSSVASQSVAKNGTVTKPADPTKEGFIFDGWYLDKEYKEKYNFSTAVTKSFTLYAKWTENDAFAQFTDVSGHWAVNAIEFVVDKGLFFGTSKNSFSPDVAMTRGMFVTVLGRLNGVSPSGNAAFSDVSSSMYYSPYIAWATSNNIVSGVGNNKFEPDREISRQEMATMMYNYAKFIGKADYEEITLADVYADAANIAAWAEEGMEYTASNKLMVGKPGDLADPLATATRAEVAQLIMQFSNFLNAAAE